MKHVLITGGSDGLGKITAQKLIAAGYKVTILSRDANKTKEAAEGLGCEYVTADVTDAAQVTAAITQVGDVDVLINNAGVWIQDAVEENSSAAVEHALQVNVLGAIYTTQAVVPGMKARKSGRIINVNSQSGFYGRQERSIYTASKWALTGFTKSLQMELKPFRIAVDGFYPGTMNTQFFAKANSHKDRSTSLDPALAADALVFVCGLPDGVSVPEFGLVSLDY